ncbi:MAG: POTRA domain-containing protein [Gammaproteobacteria bacterium]
MFNYKYSLFAIIAGMLLTAKSLAIAPELPNLPEGADAGRVSKTVPSRSTTPNPLKPLKPEEAKAVNEFGPAAASIKFPLEKVILKGNVVYSDQELSQLYKNKINKKISVVELQDIVQDITNYYRNNGYILSRALLPPQHIEHGTVTIQIIEGYIAEVNITGSPKGANYLLTAYGNRIKQSRPLQLSVLERYLFLANAIPGTSVQGVLEPSQSLTDGASTLNLASDTQLINGYISYDNFQSRYNGPLETTANINTNSIFRSGDTTRLLYLTTTKPQELKYIDLSYTSPIGTNGTNVQIGGNNSITQPEYVLAPLKLVGVARIYYANIFYPQIRSRSANLTWDGGIIYYNTRENLLNTILLYKDVIRTVTVGGTYDFYDRLNGSNWISLHATKGLPISGATTNTTSIQTSRFGATANFLIFVGQVTRTQPLIGSLSLYGTAQFQKAFVPLLAYEQFGFGGAIIGRGYDPSEILGDQGMAGSFELRYNLNPSWAFLAAAQPFIFYDIGKIWNLKDVASTKSNQSASSSGAGIRLSFNKYISGTWTIAQPLTRTEQTLEFIGRGRAPRVLFSITALD